MTLLLIQSVLVLLCAPLTVGLIRSYKAGYQNRKGASPLQPYWTLAALLRKQMTIPEHSSFVFRFVPYAVAATTIAFALIVPSMVVGVWGASLTNIFLAGALATLATVFLVWGGMDTGSTFGNMGSNREMTLTALAEPALFVTLAALALLAGGGSLDSILAFFASVPWGMLQIIAAPTLLALLLLVLAENARYPVDNPATHLELTMVHEAMLLEYSGPYLALLEYASALRLTVMGAFFMNILVPFGVLVPGADLTAVAVAVIAFLAKLVAIAFLIASIESLSVKMRFYRMQEYFSLAFLCAVAGAITIFIGIMFFL